MDKIQLRNAKIDVSLILFSFKHRNHHTEKLKALKWSKMIFLMRFT